MMQLICSRSINASPCTAYAMLLPLIDWSKKLISEACLTKLAQQLKLLIQYCLKQGHHLCQLGHVDPHTRGGRQGTRWRAWQGSKV
jgi:hypothetical protein